MQRHLGKSDDRPAERSITTVFFVAIGPGSNMRRIITENHLLADHDGGLNDLCRDARDWFVARQNGGRGLYGGHELYSVHCDRINLRQPHTEGPSWSLECRLGLGGLTVEIEPVKQKEKHE